MAENNTGLFANFDPYRLERDIEVTDHKLGHGSYATVLEVKYCGLKCAGKKIHELLLEQGDASYTVRRFEEECRLLSQVRHPNIVQFLGVYFQHGKRVPILVMEFLPTNLTSCIEQYGILPKEISYSILHDVALGLCYLHSQTPPIIHRDLSSNNVLLTPNMSAKISDLGVARILNLTPLQVSRMTQTPGTPAYMPPEVMVANPKYDTSIDVFSYGILMIHMFSGQWPEPKIGQTRIENGTLIPVTEAERREHLLKLCGSEHPLKPLIKKCINNNPKKRANAMEIVGDLADVIEQLPIRPANRLEMLRLIDTTTAKVAELQSQPLQLSSITWKPCTDLPIDIHVNSGSATIVNRKIYYGGGFAKISKDGCPDNRVYCYNPVKDCWTLLPSLPVKQFSLGRVDNELVATGGVQKVNEQPTTGDVQNRPKIGQLQKTVYTFDKRGPKWREELRPMLTARCLHCTLSLESSLVVAGGQVFPDRYTNEVEIYKVDANEWYRAKPLPVPFFNFSMALLDDKCYVVGGYNGQELQQVYHANVEALLGSASHHDQAHQTSNPQDAVWKTLPTNTPNSQSAAVAVAGNLLAIAGGQPGEKIEAGEPQSGVYAYSSSSGAWVHVGDLPSPRKICAAIEISPLEVLVIGGWASEKDPFRNDVIKGRLHCL